MNEMQLMQQHINQMVQSGNILMLVWGAALVFSMHAGFAFLEAGSVQRKNVVNALTKIVMDWSISTFVYFLIGFPIAYGISFLKPVAQITGARLQLRPLLLPAHLRGMHPRHYFRGHRRAREIRHAGTGGRHLCRAGLSLL